MKGIIRPSKALKGLIRPDKTIVGFPANPSSSNYLSITVVPTRTLQEAEKRPLKGLIRPLKAL